MKEEFLNFELYFFELQFYKKQHFIKMLTTFHKCIFVPFTIKIFVSVLQIEKQNTEISLKVLKHVVWILSQSQHF